MDEVLIISAENMGRSFIPAAYLPEGKDEYYQRNRQTTTPEGGWRHLRSDEVERLVKNNNTADNWDELLVTDVFDPNQIKNTQFYGLVRIGRLQRISLQHHDLKLPCGITNSLIISCDIGDDVAIHDVHYLAHYIIGNRNILFNIHEMDTTDHAKFGNGILKEGEPEQVRTWIDLMNETGSRQVLPFDGMTTADAYLWAKYRDDEPMQQALLHMTQHSIDNRRGYYGTTGSQCIIKNSLILKDVKVGSHCYIKGANKLKNLTINSSAEEPSQIGEGVELVNGIIGYGCHIFYGCKAVKFILGNNSNLKYGARLINSFLGDNSTISCCEVLNNLIFPAHEQHHNNSFLIAGVVMGQSNIAAGATIGSNHNSRANDLEIQAGRGFWPGLSTSVKHSCRFASFVLLSKADYAAELDIPFPFSLVSNNVSKDQLEIMPAYWWMYNMYALARNSWKFRNRDKRILKTQHIEFDPYAPDTMEEVIHAMELLEIWTGKALLRDAGTETGKDPAAAGRQALQEMNNSLGSLEILGENMENAHRKAVILKPVQAYRAYRDMLWYYAGTNLVRFFESYPEHTWEKACSELGGERITQWVNMGGQIMPDLDLDALRRDIGSGMLPDWAAVHNRYDMLWNRYEKDKQKHAFAVLCLLHENRIPDRQEWLKTLIKVRELQTHINQMVYDSRKKDFENPFRKITFRNQKEMDSTLGTVDQNDFIRRINQEGSDFKNMLDGLMRRFS